MMVMSSVVWHHLIGVDAAGLRRARVQTHSAAQWLARAALASIPARPDDGHTNFGWSDTFGGFVTHALPDGARLGLKVTDLTLAVLDHAGADTAIMLPLDGCSDAQVRAWLGRGMAAGGLDPYALDNPTPYEMPAIANGAVYEAAELANLLSVHRLVFKRQCGAWRAPSGYHRTKSGGPAGPLLAPPFRSRHIGDDRTRPYNGRRVLTRRRLLQ